MANLNVGHPVNVDRRALKAVGKHKVEVSTPHYAAGVTSVNSFEQGAEMLKIATFLNRQFSFGTYPNRHDLLLSNANLNVGHPVNVDRRALKAVGKHKVEVSTPHY
jgi:hypothetical protein